MPTATDEQVKHYQSEARKAAGTLTRCGLDGKSQPIIELHMPCGCQWTRDGRVRLGTCTACFVEGMRDAVAILDGKAGA